MGFDVRILQIGERRTVPWNNALAETVEEGLSIRELDALVRLTVPHLII